MDLSGNNWDEKIRHKVIAAGKAAASRMGALLKSTIPKLV
jgi:hypothetical protein